VLAAGGTAVEAVEAAINVMEDSPLFNAGKGASYTTDGTVELDASIMDGRTMKAGGVAVVALGGSGGAIALDKNGNFAMPYTDNGMYRGWVRADGVIEVCIHDK
jgi:isoaspartyl peptidase/L-asparaginase-like protein (Ntn-hydrolase superfamily)